MKWRKFSEEKPKPQSAILIADHQGIMKGFYEWFPTFVDWPEHTQNLSSICGKWVSNPLYWMYYEEFVKEILPKE